MSRRHKAFKFIAIVVAAAVVQLTLQLSFAEADNSSTPPGLNQQPLLGRISIKGDQRVTINGNNAAAGDTVVTGSLIQTLNRTEASVELGPLGSVDLGPDTKTKIDYQCPVDKLAHPNAQSCTVHVTLFAGCVTSNYKQNSHHEIENEQHVRLAESDPAKEISGGGVLKICSSGAPATEPHEGGPGKKGLFAIILAGVTIPTAIVLIGAGGDNPSNSTP